MKVALKKNNRLIGEKPPNLVGIEEENHVVVQSSRINLHGQRCVELFHSQFTLRPVVRRVMTFYLQSTSRPVVRKITPFAIHIVASST